MYKIFFIILQSRLTPYTQEIIGIISVDSEAPSQQLIIYSGFIKYLWTFWNTMKQCISRGLDNLLWDP